MDVSIKPLIPDLIDDFLNFFDNIAFEDNPDWAGCYCYFHHCKGDLNDWAERMNNKADNREDSKNLILLGKLNGFLAFKKDKPIGWVNIDSKEAYLKLPIEEARNFPDDGKIASVVCFVIALTQRRKGLARNMLRFACSSLKDKGYNIVEAYPKK